MNTLSYTSATRGLVPIPASERDIPTATADPFFKVSDIAMPLEGPAFDRHGNLLFVDIPGGRILQLSPEGVLSVIYTDKGLNPSGIAIHKDGRVFVAAAGAKNSKGRFDAGTIIAMNPDGTNRQSIVPPSAGYVPNDLVFDEHGGFYLTDFRGASTCADGGVAMNRQGRVLVFSPFGIPIGQILLPGRDNNLFMRSTSLALSPGSRDLFIVSRDEVGTGGSMIFKAQGLAEGLALFSHR